eukprot:TRINITY_DN11801_c0_g1_i1.p1 TRINITY_DN11801_c0_g1~~TRINITY_DN11801_c0_g1_i1.p1  ORF type:complete len:381 (-),score=100.24 TRINITY_DN11801_c0_g1_i1:254-1396(-)
MSATLVNHTESGGVNGNESDGAIPDGIAALLPSDPFELMDLSRKIAVLAYQARERGDEQGGGGGSKGSYKQLEEKVEELEISLKEASEKLTKSHEDQVKLTNEKTALVAMVKKLNRDVAKLETFKRTLMQQLQDENDDEAPSMSVGASLQGATAKVVQLADSVTTPGGKLSVPPADSDESDSSGAYAAEEDASSSSAITAGTITNLPGPGAGSALRIAQAARASAVSASVQAAAAMDAVAGAGATSNDDDDGEGGASGAAPSRILRNVRTPSRLTPSMTPNLFSPQYTPSVTPPHSSSTAASPRTKEGRPPRVDGKEFFRQARSRLSYEQFSSFLANIKELNAHRQTREETLKKADEIFGSENKDLYTAFDGLLSRHLPT